MKIRYFLVLGFLALVPGNGAHAHGQVATGDRTMTLPESGPLAEAVTFFRAGRYDEALTALRRLSRGGEATPLARRLYARALIEVGR